MDWHTLLVPLIAAVCALIAAFIRAASPAGHFFHTKAGLMLLSLGSGVCDAAAEALRHGWNAATLIGAVTAAILAVAFGMNPSIARDGSSKILAWLVFAAAVSGRIVVLVVLGVSLVLSGCGPVATQIRKDIGAQCGQKNEEAYSALKTAVTQVLVSGLPFDSIEHALLMLVPLATAGLPAIVCMVKVVIVDLKAGASGQVKDEVRALAAPAAPDYAAGINNGERFLGKYDR